MNKEELRAVWKQEENIAYIKGWDFSHIQGKYREEEHLPWDLKEIIQHYLTDESNLLDYDTGGGEFLLSLKHPYEKTAATEGYPPNVQLCSEKLLPLGIDFKECNDPSHIPYENEAFDIVINRHGSFDPKELHRLLKKDGIFVTQQVGANNERELVEMVLPDSSLPYPHLTLEKQRQAFEDAGFEILLAQEAYRPIRFYDIGAFVWFARIIQWEFPGFSVDNCFDQLLQMQETLKKKGVIEGTTHRFLIVAKKI